MNEILSTAVALTVLVAVFAGLVAWVRRDALAGSHRPPAPAGADTVEREQEPVNLRRPSPAVRRSRVLQVSGS